MKEDNDDDRRRKNKTDEIIIKRKKRCNSYFIQKRHQWVSRKSTMEKVKYTVMHVW